MDKENQLALEARKELTEHIIPFWMGLRDDGYGGYYGMLDYSLKLDKKASEGLHTEQQDTLVLLGGVYHAA
jgi:hypothetical protein